MNILIPNLGSTSLKYQLIEMPAERTLARGRLERVADFRAAIGEIDTGGAPSTRWPSRPCWPARAIAARS